MTPSQAADGFQRVFQRIAETRMAGLPLLNPALRVEAVGFRMWQERVTGMVVTPWLMSLVLLPGKNDHWGDQPLGRKRAIDFPSGGYDFLLNELDGIGRFLGHSLYSPMDAFASQEHALAAARAFLDALFLPREEEAADVVDEALLGRILRGEEAAPEPPAPAPAGEQALSRRELLRGEWGR